MTLAGLIAPLVAARLGGWILILRQLGVKPNDPLRWILSAAFGVFTVVGMLWAAWLRNTRPHVYAQIDSGGGHRPRRTSKPFAPTASAW